MKKFLNISYLVASLEAAQRNCKNMTGKTLENAHKKILNFGSTKVISITSFGRDRVLQRSFSTNNDAFCEFLINCGL